MGRDCKWLGDILVMESRVASGLMVEKWWLPRQRGGEWQSDALRGE